MKIILLIFAILLRFEVHGRTILVTCATGSIGSEVVRNLRNEGHEVIAAGRNIEKLKLITGDTMQIDFSDLESLLKVGEKIKPVDGVILIGPRPMLGKDPTAAQWQSAFTEAFIAPLALLNTMHIKDGGSIVIISGNTSKSYFTQYPNTNVIRVAWSAELKNLVQTMKDKKIRVNIISPGPLMTDHHIEKIKQAANQNKVTYDEEMSDRTKGIPAGKYGELSNVADLVSFLISDRANHINGTNIAIDGGENLGYD